MYILGINESENSSAAILKDGKILACVLEERFTLKKGQAGLPLNSINYCLNEAHITKAKLDLVVVGSKNSSAAVWYRTSENSNLKKIIKTQNSILVDLVCGFYPTFPFVLKIYQGMYKFFYFFYSAIKPVIFASHKKSLSKRLGIENNKLLFMDHQLAHAFAANYIFGKSDKKRLVVTNDGAGDDFCGAVYITSGDKWEKIAATPNKYSLGYIYYYITQLLGMKPNQDEYKVMGLAPYANNKSVSNVYSLLKDLIWNDGLKFKSKLDRVSYYCYLKTKLAEKRFDEIAGALQNLTEELVVTQIKNAITKTGIRDLYLGGGLFQNIKANLKISEISSVNILNVCPSSGDESVALGGCFYGYLKICQQKKFKFAPIKIDNLQFGPAYSNSEIKAELKRTKMNKPKFIITKLNKNKAKIVSRLLAKGEVVARFEGKLEFGQRAMGNRSILADPRNPKIIRVLNEQIKGRDFWMPFAPTILDERVDDYLINPKKLYSPFMMIGFKSTDQAKKEIPATLHPVDLTCRVQMIRREDNTDYYDLIKEFENLTGVGALLNTSFNMHGEPIVCSPSDAIRTFKKTGLKYLLIGDFLIRKENNG